MMTKKKKDIVIHEGESREMIIYRDSDNAPKVEVLLQHENLWLTQKSLSMLFDVNIPAISKHIKNIFETGELQENSVVSKMETTAADGKSYNTTFYNLDLVIAVGYRVNSGRAIIFRNWAREILKEYIKKGSVLDMKRLKNPEYIFGRDYFDETLERIRDIRSSERRFYQKITDIYADCSADYDVNSETTKRFFA
ncbi:MAG: virulence RhuM family protein, partial [Bacteroidales bacterium]|nr:virulence RhuM family protein [Bacteroidales bacterium]